MKHQRTAALLLATLVLAGCAGDIGGPGEAGGSDLGREPVNSVTGEDRGHEPHASQPGGPQSGQSETAVFPEKETAAGEETPTGEPLIGNVTVVEKIGTSICRPEIVTTTLEGFLTAFHEGDLDRLGLYFGPDLQWFWNAGIPGVEEPYSGQVPEEIVAYLAQRRKQGERMRFPDLRIVAPFDNKISYSFLLHRTADDLGAGGVTQVGKGAIDCLTKTFVVWGAGIVPPSESPESQADGPPAKSRTP